MFKKILYIIIWSAVIVLIFISLGFTVYERNRIVCSEVRVEVKDSLETQFVRGKEIRDWVRNRFPSVYRQNLEKIDLRKIEDGLRKIKAIEDVAVFNYIVGKGKPGEGALVIQIKQRTPQFRVDVAGRDYYIDKLGKSIDWSPNYTPRVIMVSGNTSYEFARKSLLPLISYLHEDPFLNAQIDQIYVAAKGNLILIPRVGDQQIIFGSADDYPTKFRNLKALYQEGFKEGGWTRYKTINLTYKNQVICLKR